MLPRRDDRRPAKNSRLRTWRQLWLALLPALPFLSVTAFFQLNRTSLPVALRSVFAVFTLTQLLAALCSPTPPLSVLLAAVRCVFVAGLLCAGSRMRFKDLSFLGFGLALVYATAFLDALLAQRGDSLLTLRLSHPYYTSTALGIAGSFGVVIAAASHTSRVAWRLPLGVAGLAVILLSGSRSALLAALVGLLLVAGLRWGARVLAVGLPVAVGVVCVPLLLHTGTFVDRFGSLDNSNRDVVWQNTLSVIEAHPWGGVGPYQLGAALSTGGHSCELWTSLRDRGIACPEVVSQLDGAWLIAHNLLLHALAESGVIGTTGYVLLVTLSVLLVLRTGSGLLVGLTATVLLFNLVDNTLAVPSLFFAEVFWLGVGMAARVLLDSQEPSGAVPASWAWGLPAGALVLTLVFLFPLWSPQRASTTPPPRLESLVVDREDRRAFVRLDGVSGSYRFVVRSCAPTCRTLFLRPITLVAGAPWQEWIDLDSTATAPLLFELYPGTSPPWALQPLARRRVEGVTP
ncbi:O-antigen ligase family protein [Deinococcus pimensis]|uniref:O-antigen ligase family protein n=1 Tax=Deinococcus pimensis TaxID=309888 RepID=UPI001FE00DD6|nr:O-antigen ligase family protein [Deinococcus pimensis]